MGFAVVPEVYISIAMSRTRTRSCERVDLPVLDRPASRVELIAGQETWRGPFAGQQHDVAQHRRLRQLQVGRILRGQTGEYLVQESRIVGRPGGPGGGEQDADIRMADHVAELMGLEAAVDRNNDRPELARADQGDYEVHAVVHEDPNLVAPAHAKPVQTAGEAGAPRGELRIADPFLGEDDGMAIGPIGGPIDQIADCCDLDPPGAHALLLSGLGPKRSVGSRSVTARA